MLKSLDSIVIEYTVNKNKKLAVKFIKTERGVQRLNFLKKNFSKEEIKSLLKKVPESIKNRYQLYRSAKIYKSRIKKD